MPVPKIPTVIFVIGNLRTGKTKMSQAIQHKFDSAFNFNKDDLAKELQNKKTMWPPFQASVDQDTIYKAILKVVMDNIENSNRIAILQGNFAQRFVDGKLDVVGDKLTDLFLNTCRVCIIRMKCYDPKIQHTRMIKANDPKDATLISGSYNNFLSYIDKLERAEIQWLSSIRNKVHYLELDNTSDESFDDNVNIMEKFVRRALSSNTPPLAPTMSLTFTTPTLKLSAEHPSPIRTNSPPTVGSRKCTIQNRNKLHPEIEPVVKPTHKRSTSSMFIPSFFTSAFTTTTPRESKSPRIQYNTDNEREVIVDLQDLDRPLSDGAVPRSGKNIYKNSL